MMALVHEGRALMTQTPLKVRLLHTVTVAITFQQDEREQTSNPQERLSSPRLAGLFEPMEEETLQVPLAP
jgi:hypothetical protein